MEKSKSRSFWALIATQFFGAFNDNLYKIAVALLVVRWVSDEMVRNNWVSVSNLLFVFPFLAFSMVSGRASDRWSKARVIRTTKIMEVGVIALSVLAISLKNIPLMMTGLALLALQSTFFAPAKYGLLPEVLKNKDLSGANGILNASTILAILAGTIAGSFFIGSPVSLGILMGLVTLGGLVSSFLIESVPAAKPNQPLRWNPIPEFLENWKSIKDNPVLRRSLWAVSYFWFLGAVLILNTVIYVNDLVQAPPFVMGLLESLQKKGVTLDNPSEVISGAFLFINGLGIGAGSLIAGRLSREKVELGLVPIGAIGMSVFTLDLYFAHPSFYRCIGDGFFLGLSTGLFVIPLNTLIQSRSPKDIRGRILATANFISFIAIGCATPFIWFFGSLLKLGPAQVFLALGLFSVGATIIICSILPQALVRLVLYALTNTIYKIRVVGRENVPLNGPALLVPNHVSFVDGFLVSGALSRVVRFIMWRTFYEKPWIHPLVKLMGAIPIAANDNPKEIMRSLLNARKKLQEGHLVCIFAEGTISRLGGTTLGFQRGLDVILKGLDIPVIPVHLEGVWGSIFSYEGKKFLWKKPKKIPYPVTVTFGKPLQKTNAAEVRQAVMDLGSQAFAIHRQKEPTLFSAFLKIAKSHPKQNVVADSSGKELTYHQLLTAAALLGKNLKPFFTQTQTPHVGILIPPSVGGAVANLACAAEGWIPVNLNYTLSQSAIQDICKKAHVKKIITSEKLLKKLNWEKTDQFILIEECLAKITNTEKIRMGLLTRLLPRFFLQKLFFPNSQKNLPDLATLMFTSGSTGIPKGVMLTEGNILSNIQALTMILQVEPKDVILGVLPFFHSFGYTASLWFPLLAGFKAAYHNNPLDSKTVALLSKKHKVTFLIGTPTFLSTYLRRIAPDDFKTLRFAVAGAEKLRPEFAKAFEEKYNVPILEGYGCTELSPVVALNVPDIMDGELLQVGRKVGKIGRPIPGVSVKVVDPDTHAPLTHGTAGLLLVKGPNVMKGYLHEPEKTADVLKDGFYITGDIATVDSDGFIEITDRLSRFSKIGGEMVPHIKVEQKLQELAQATERMFVVTSVPDEKKGEALVVLVAGFSGDLDALWKNLNSSDLPKLWVPARDQFYSVESIPVLGSGKVDMQQVKTWALEKQA